MSSKADKKSKAAKGAALSAKYSVESYKNKIMVFLNQNKKKVLSCSELAAKCHSRKGCQSNYNTALRELAEDGIIFIKKQQKVVLSSKMGYYPAKVTRLSKTFGFVVTDDGTEVFIPGKLLLGTMPEDKVLISYIKSRSGSPEGEVVDILKEGSSRLTGKIEVCDGEPYFVSDTMSKNHIRICEDDNAPFNDGDKVVAELVYRGRRHADHKVRIETVLGNSENAAACAKSILLIHGIEEAFPADALKDTARIAEAGIHDYDFNNREDLRELTVFTIDSAESKDLDDAVSIEKTKNGYRLGVHIADVSHYVKGNSALDKEALRRGTSIYYANKVIPMLPKELSNGICSLNPNENRLTMSAFIDLNNDGEMISYGFCKSVICSRVKGVYSEINQILDGTESADIKEKYKDVRNEIFIMNELADILIENKKRRHAPQIETIESKLVIDENDVCVDVMPRTRGKSECIIEEFMLKANEAAAQLAKEKGVPFVYRVHEAPPPEKAEKLKEIVRKFGIECPPFTEIKPVHIAEIIENAKGTDVYEAVNLIALRSMAKAKYLNEPLGHFGLVLDDYAHFTSPIRRYPDLAIHRILTDILAGYDKAWLNKRYSGFALNAAERSSSAEIRAVTVERECEDCYKAEFMKSRVGQSFEGKISSVTEFGFYVTLENTVEGLVHIRTLPGSEYDYSEPAMLTEKFSGVTYKLGDKVNVICVAVSVNDGLVDFVLDESN